MSSKERSQLVALWIAGVTLMVSALVLMFAHLVMLSAVAGVIAVACYLFSLASAWKSILQMSEGVKANEE